MVAGARGARELNQIRLFIVDSSFDDPAPGYWRDALAAVRESGRITVVGSAPSPGEALTQIQRVSADLVVIDLTRPTTETAVLLDALSAVPFSVDSGDSFTGDPSGGGEIPVVGLCDVVDEAHLAVSISAGVRACAGRDDPEALAAAIIEVARGGAPIQRDLAGKPALLWNLALELRRRLRGTWDSSNDRARDRVSNGSLRGSFGGSSRSNCPISTREIAILEMVADGCSYREIGETLTIAERTVKNHMARSLEKLGARGRAHAVRVALEAGWICTGPAAGSIGLRAAA